MGRKSVFFLEFTCVSSGMNVVTIGGEARRN